MRPFPTRGWRVILPSCLCTLMLIGAVLADTGDRRRCSAVPKNPDDKAIAHVLNRLGFGPPPGDIDRVRKIGLERNIDQQLRPETIAISERFRGSPISYADVNQSASSLTITVSRRRRWTAGTHSSRPHRDLPRPRPKKRAQTARD